MFERASQVELSQLAEALEPPCQLGPYRLTGELARSQTAVLFTASGGVFEREEGVVKLTSGHHAPRLQAELRCLVRCADAGVGGVVRPLRREVDWLRVPGLVDAHIAAIAMPFLSGGDLATIRRTGSHQRSPAAFAVEVGRVVAATLRHMLDLSEPLVHGNLNMRNVLLPRPTADLAELTLIGFGSARELLDLSSADLARACVDDVGAFGRLLDGLIAGAHASRQIQTLIAGCLRSRYASMADPKLWRALQQAEHAERTPDGRGWLARVWRRSA